MFELMLAAAFVLFAGFAWLEVRELEEKVAYYRDKYRQCSKSPESAESLAESKVEEEDRRLFREKDMLESINEDLCRYSALLEEENEKLRKALAVTHTRISRN